MNRNRIVHHQKPAHRWLMTILFSSVMLICAHSTIMAQEDQRIRPTWWFGVAGAANLNFYGGTTQMLNSSLTTPAAFHKGYGGGLYLAPLIEYRPHPVWGGMLQVGYDDRRGSFDDVPCPCGEIATLSAKVSYISIEPSLRFAPFSGGFYIFGGPRIGFNWAVSDDDENEFIYTQEGTADTRARFSDMKTTVFSAQIGMGYDIPLSSPANETQVNLSPFVSFQPYFGQEPRSVESWGVTTVRVGAALKFGNGTAPARAAELEQDQEVLFSVRAPNAVPVKRRVRETFPLRNYIFFEEGSSEIPNRYVTLTKNEAAEFTEEQLQEDAPTSMRGRSARQMDVYHNILNTIGDRMKRSPGTSITLIGASEMGPDHGRARAESIKRYLVDVFGITGTRITTDGRSKPKVPSTQPGGTKELALLLAGDSRVDIESDSPEMLIQVGGDQHYMLKPVKIVGVVEDPLDSHVFFNVVGATDLLTAWTLEITDEQGNVQHFGPYTRERETISGNAILGARPDGEFKVVMRGKTTKGKTVTKESSVSLTRRDEVAKEAVRFSILFDFDKSKTMRGFEKFLADDVAPLVPPNGNVLIHGHTDIIGEEEYNYNLSRERVQETRAIMERALLQRGTRGVTFETLWFGEGQPPFENNFPEERFYNRSVIIDIVPK